jgi:hypothetical protein
MNACVNGSIDKWVVDGADVWVEKEAQAKTKLKSKARNRSSAPHAPAPAHRAIAPARPTRRRLLTEPVSHG